MNADLFSSQTSIRWMSSKKWRPEKATQISF